MRTAQLIAEQGARTEPKSASAPKRKMHPNSLKNLVAPWEPGHSGNPEGGRRRDVAAEISRAIIENNRKAIYEAGAAKLMAGDSYAYSVHADRAYGKMKQGIIHTGDEDGGPIKTSIKVEFVEPDGK